MTNQVGSYEAKTKLPELLRLVEQGKHYTVTNRGKPIAEIVPTRLHADHKINQAITNITKHKAAVVPDSMFKKLLDEVR